MVSPHHEAQRDHLLLQRAQLRQRRPQRLPLAHRVRQVHALQWRPIAGGVERHTRAAPAPAEVIDDDMVGDGVQPADQGSLAAVLEGPRVLPDLDEHLLDHILGGLGLPEAKRAIAHQRGGVQLVQRLQGAGIARAQGGNEGGQVGRLGRHRAARSRAGLLAECASPRALYARLPHRRCRAACGWCLKRSPGPYWPGAAAGAAGAPTGYGRSRRTRTALTGSARGVAARGWLEHQGCWSRH